MDFRTMEEAVENLNRRVDRIEQILPTLATKDDLRKAIAPLATKEELRRAIAPLATKEEVRAEGERTRAHFDAVAERLEEQIRLLAEGLLSLEQRLTRLEARYAES